MDPRNPDDRHGPDEPTRPLDSPEPEPPRQEHEPTREHGWEQPGAAEGPGAGDAGATAGAGGAPGGAPGGGPGLGYPPPAYGPYGFPGHPGHPSHPGNPGYPSYPGYPGHPGAGHAGHAGPGPTPPRPSHASGPLMTPGEGGFGPASAPPYAVPPRRPKQARGRSGPTPVLLVLAAVLAGGLAGVAGAAGYNAVVEPPTRPVVDALKGSPSADAEASDAAPDGSVEAVASEVLPSVVKIDVSSGGSQGSGSGIILTSDGTILTNYHVVEFAEDGGQIAVSFNDGTTAEAEIVGTDPLTDLAVIKAEGVSGVKPADLGSSGAVDVGEEVVAVGSPFGLESTVTSGIVSAIHRPVSAGDVPGADSTIFPAIQTDAAINPGNSGGPLVNMQGEVIGINTAIRSTSSLSGTAGSIGLGFAIPVDEAEPIAQQLREGETPTHAQIGVTVGTGQNEEGLPGGAVVRSVTPGSAADRAGLQVGDLITRVNDAVIPSSDTLVAIVRTYRPGDRVQLTVERDGELRQISLVLGSDAAG